jgi:hypothetical protein
MLSYNDDSYSELIKKHTLKYLIKHINNIDNEYLKGLHLLIAIDDKFKVKFLTLLKETQKQIK